MKHLWKFAVVGSLVFVAAGCGTSSEAEEKTEEVSILTAVLAEDPVITWRLSSGEVYADITLKDTVKLKGEFNPRVLRIPNLKLEQINGDFTELTEGTKIRLVTELRPITTRSYPGQMGGNSVKEFTILD
ncbi:MULTISPECIES: hypothetical protein [unclassified Enterococcus]|jgi:hypothetical protein|uniref:hypothetical protein n=1 Tax=unclassified Enterococcus TaxID=2608891 RepID=UPI003D2AF2ED